MMEVLQQLADAFSRDPFRVASALLMAIPIAVMTVGFVLWKIAQVLAVLLLFFAPVIGIPYFIGIYLDSLFFEKQSPWMALKTLIPKSLRVLRIALGDCYKALPKTA